ncbi:hypothetical protein NMY22_g16078 [Coprinellus aureogranulatus]|nr:hypothetical protein NMY22_g16078 [Coprinellus aureogranulatus]
MLLNLSFHVLYKSTDFACLAVLVRAFPFLKKQVSDYANLQAAEALHTMPQEVSLIWQAEWNVGKVLYLLNRYIPFAGNLLALLCGFNNLFELYHPGEFDDAMRSAIHCSHARDAGWVDFRGKHVASKLRSQSPNLLLVILYLRVFALSGKSRPIGGLLLILFLLPGAASVFLVLFSMSLEYEPSPAPAVISCLPVTGRPERMTIAMILVAASELIILLLTLWLLFYRFWGSTSHLVASFYRDGAVYFVTITSVAIGSIICNVVAPVCTNSVMVGRSKVLTLRPQPGYAYLLLHPQLVLHSVIITRMVFHMRGIDGIRHGASEEDIPLTEVRYAVRLNVKVDESIG